MAPLLPLDDFRRMLGYNPFHFWGLTDNFVVPVTSACNTLVQQYAWQDADQPGRSELLDAIEVAEARLREHLGYPVAPQFITTTIPWRKFYNRNMVRRMNWDPTGQYISGRLPDTMLQAVGAEVLNLIGSVALTFSDTDGDGLNDTFVSAPIATTVTDIARIHAYFQAADRLDGEGAVERWRIKPLLVTISGGQVTVRGKAWLLVRPVLYEGAGAKQVDPTVPGNFAANLDLYEHKADPNGTTVDTAQAVLRWETVPCHGWWCACSTCGGSYSAGMNSTDPASYAVAIARVGIRDAEAGLVTPAESTYDAASGNWANAPWDVWREPDTVTVRYLAGQPLENGLMSRKWQTIVARMAAAELAGRLCACDTANRELYRWQFDLARSSGANDEAYGAITREDLNNPFGTRRGHVFAWREVRRNMSLLGIIAQQ